MKKLILIFVYFVLLISFVCLTGGYGYSQSGWVLQSPLPTTETLLSIKFVNKNTGFISGTNGIILKTTNIGFSWSKINTGFAYHSLMAIDFFDENTGLVVSDTGIVLKTSDGGNSWYQINIPLTHWFWAVTCPTINIAYIVGSSGTILKSTDKGNNWIILSSNIDSLFLSVSFINENTGVVISNSGLVLKTTNGGINWNQQILQQTTHYLKTVNLIDSNIGFIAGGLMGSEIHKTTNGGTNWFIQNTLGRTIYGISFINSNTGIAVGDATILNTTDGGNIWVSHNVNYVRGYSSVYFINKDSAFISGDYGEIEFTPNGGYNWQVDFSGSRNNLNAIWFVNQLTGFAAGEQSQLPSGIIKTTNGGLNWLNSFDNTPVIFSDLFFLNPDTGFAAEVYDKFYATTNGGQNWSNYSIPNTQSSYHIYFLNYYTGYAV